MFHRKKEDPAAAAAAASGPSTAADQGDAGVPVASEESTSRFSKMRSGQSKVCNCVCVCVCVRACVCSVFVCV